MADALSILHDAYTSVRSYERNRAIAQLTIDHLIQEQIDLIRGAVQTTVGTGAGRLSKLERLDAIERSVDDLVSGVEAAGNDEAKLAALGLSAGVKL